MNRVQNIQSKVWKYKTVECFKIKNVRSLLASFASTC